MSDAPRRPGAYVFLSERHELLYVGKANDLRARLAAHEREGRLRDVAAVRWVVCGSEAEALQLEADIVVALQPPRNAAMTREGFWFIAVDGDRFVLTTDPSGDGEVFGGFPHLGKGKATSNLVRSNAGYAAFLRCLWVAASDLPVPSRLRGDSPPADHRGPDTDLKLVRAYLSGTSDRILRGIDADVADPVVRRSLAADLEGATSFFRHGPKRIRAMARRHGVRCPIDRVTFAGMVEAELREAIGDFVRPHMRHTDHVERRMARSRQTAEP